MASPPHSERERDSSSAASSSSSLFVFSRDVENPSGPSVPPGFRFGASALNGTLSPRRPASSSAASSPRSPSSPFSTRAQLLAPSLHSDSDGTRTPLAAAIGEEEEDDGESKWSLFSAARSALVLLCLVLLAATLWNVVGELGSGDKAAGSHAPQQTSAAAVVTPLMEQLSPELATDAPSPPPATATPRSTLPPMPPLNVRILSSGSAHHAELERLLRSLQEAEYELGVDSVSLTLLVDTPRNLTRPPPVLRQDSKEEEKEEQKEEEEVLELTPEQMKGMSEDEVIQALGRIEKAKEERAARQALKQKQRKTNETSSQAELEAYRSLKYEHELHLLLVRNLQWVHGSVRVLVPAPSADGSPSHAGVLDQLLDWNPADSEELALVLRDTQVLSPQWMRIMRMVHARLLADSERAKGVVGLVLESAERVLGAEGVKDEWTDREWDSILSKAIPADRPSLVLSQALTGLGAAHGGGILLRAAPWIEFRKWLSDPARGVLLPSSAASAAESATQGEDLDDGGVQHTPAHFNPASRFNPCVPNLVLNGWWPQLNTKDQGEQLESALQKRQDEPWFFSALLARFMHERQLLLAHLLLPSGAALASSPQFLLAHSHDRPHAQAQGESAADHLSHADGRSTLAVPLRRGLLKELDEAEWDGAITQSVQALNKSSVWDASGRAVPYNTWREKMDKIAAAGDKNSSKDSSKQCALKIRGVPTSPPSLQPSAEQLTQLLQISKTTPHSHDHEHEHSHEAVTPSVSTSTKSPAPPSSSTPPTAKPAGSSPAVSGSTEGLSQKDLLQNALQTALAHQAVLPPSPLDDPAAWDVLADERQTDASSLPPARVLPASEVEDDLVSRALKRWEEFEAEFQMQYARVAGNDAATKAAQDKLSRLRVAYEGHVAVLREQLETKKLIATLRDQLEAIARAEQEAEEDKLIAAYQRAKGVNPNGKELQTPGSPAAKQPIAPPQAQPAPATPLAASADPKSKKPKKPVGPITSIWDGWNPTSAADRAKKAEQEKEAQKKAAEAAQAAAESGADETQHAVLSPEELAELEAREKEEEELRLALSRGAGKSPIELLKELEQRRRERRKKGNKSGEEQTQAENKQEASAPAQAPAPAPAAPTPESAKPADNKPEGEAKPAPAEVSQPAANKVADTSDAGSDISAPAAAPSDSGSDGTPILSDDEYEKLMAARRERKRQKQHNPLFWGRRR